MNFKRIILTSRPSMWPWTALMYLVGIGNFSNLSAISIVEVLFFTFPLNFYLYGLNDVYDAKSDRINERKKGAQGIAPEDAEIEVLKKIVWISVVLFLIVSLFSRNLQHIALSLAFVVLSFTYSHKSFRVKEIPILDCFNSAAIYCVPALVAYSLRSSIVTLPYFVFFIILAYAGMHAMTTLIDVEADKQAGMKTVGTVLGRNGAAIFSMFMFAASLFIFWDVILLKSVFLVSIFLHLIFLVSENDNEKYLRFAGATILISFMMVALVYFIFQNNLV